MATMLAAVSLCLAIAPGLSHEIEITPGKVEAAPIAGIGAFPELDKEGPAGYLATPTCVIHHDGRGRVRTVN